MLDRIANEIDKECFQLDLAYENKDLKTVHRPIIC